MEEGQLAGLIILSSMALGFLAIVGFCLHVFWSRQCASNSVEDGSVSPTADRKTHPTKGIFNISGRVPPPPPLYPPPPPGVCGTAETSVVSNNTTHTGMSESEFESTHDSMASGNENTIPSTLFTSDPVASTSTKLPLQSQRRLDARYGGSISPAVSVINEVDEDVISWSDNGRQNT